MPIPHTFPSLLNPDAPRSVLLIGAGMSNGMAPPVALLTNEIRQKHDEIIQKLGINIPPPIGNDFYDWADDAIKELKYVHALSDNDAKLRLADAMGITHDRRFHAKENMPIRGNTPRHRVIARLAREGRLTSIWSLNWDCILESAFESVGLLQHPNPGTTKQNPLPWKRWYCTWSPGDQHNPNAQGQASTQHVVKPHGCVNKLANGDATSFIVTRSELSQLPTKLERIVTGRMIVGFSDLPLITSGWRADEQYIHKIIEDIKALGNLLHNDIDRLSIINRTWYPEATVNPPIQHDRIAAAFDVVRTSCYFSVEKAGEPKIDEIYQWLQTSYGLGVLLRYVRAPNQEAIWRTEAPLLEQVHDKFLQPLSSHWLNIFFDDYLHVWVRMCFNSKCVIYWNQGAIPQDQVATNLRDEHIPWGYVQTDRLDLLAIIPLILALWKNESCRWNFSEYPGALWDEREGHLVLPLPAWGPQGKLIGMAALKPLMDGWNWSNKGDIEKFSVLPLLPKVSYSVPTDSDTILRNSVASLSKEARFADAAKIGVLSLSDL